MCTPPSCILPLRAEDVCLLQWSLFFEEQNIPGGGPQGGLLIVIFFNLQANLVGVPCPVLPTYQVSLFSIVVLNLTPYKQVPAHPAILKGKY